MIRESATRFGIINFTPFGALLLKKIVLTLFLFKYILDITLKGKT